MKPKISKIYNECEDWDSDDIDRLISELEVLANAKYDEEEEEKDKAYNDMVAEESAILASKSNG